MQTQTKHIIWEDDDGYPVGRLPLSRREARRTEPPPAPESRLLRAAPYAAGLAAAGLVGACLLVQAIRVAGAVATLPLGLLALAWWLARRRGR